MFYKVKSTNQFGATFTSFFETKQGLQEYLNLPHPPTRKIVVEEIDEDDQDYQNLVGEIALAEARDNVQEDDSMDRFLIYLDYFISEVQSHIGYPKAKYITENPAIEQLSAITGYSREHWVEQISKAHYVFDYENILEARDVINANRNVPEIAYIVRTIGRCTDLW